MSKKLHIVSEENGWAIKGAVKPVIFKTKKDATGAAREMALNKNIIVVSVSKDGQVIDVSGLSKGVKVETANVKSTINKQAVRNAIAQVSFENEFNIGPK
jgi:hypothetical protein